MNPSHLRRKGTLDYDPRERVRSECDVTWSVRESATCPFVKDSFWRVCRCSRPPPRHACRPTPSPGGTSTPSTPGRSTAPRPTWARGRPRCWAWTTTTPSAAATRSRAPAPSPTPPSTRPGARPTPTSSRPRAPSGDPNAWRVRGPSNNIGAAQGNGWAVQALQYSQGVQFSAGTVGYGNILFHFDWFTTTQGVKNLQEQYTLNGTTWININPLLTAVSNGFETQTIDFSKIAGAANDPNFGVRLVSAYDPTLSIPNYGSADGGQNGVYNNNSGNWRFTAVGFTGTPLAAVPEPSPFLLGAFRSRCLGLAAFRR